MGKSRLKLMMAFVLAIMMTLILTSVVSAEPPSSGGGYWYQVKHGDTWYNLSRRTGLSFQTLWNANPDHHHINNWLFYGHWLWIPSSPTPAPEPRGGYWYQVVHGDTWYGLSRKTGLSFQALWDANPTHHHINNWLFYGHWLWIPN
jgi:hypothetical protein